MILLNYVQREWSDESFFQHVQPTACGLHVAQPSLSYNSPTPYFHGGGPSLLNSPDWSQVHTQSSERHNYCVIGTVCDEIRTWERGSAVLIQVMANKCMLLNILAKSSPVNRKKVCILNFWTDKGIWQQISSFLKKKIYIFCYIHDSIFSQDKHITCKFSKGMYIVAIRYSVQKFDHISLLEVFEFYLTREGLPLLHNHSLFMLSFSGSIYICIFKDEAKEE